MKTRLFLILALVLVLLFSFTLTACGEEETGENPTSSSQHTDAEVIKDADGLFAHKDEIVSFAFAGETSQNVDAIKQQVAAKMEEAVYEEVSKSLLNEVVSGVVGASGITHGYLREYLTLAKNYSFIIREYTNTHI